MHEVTRRALTARRDVMARRVVAALLGCLCVVAIGTTALATVEPSDSAPTTEAPVDTTAPPSEETTPADTLVGAGDPDDDIDGTVAAVAVIGFVALLAVASWWMVRRTNPDDQPLPQGPPSVPPSDLV